MRRFVLAFAAFFATSLCSAQEVGFKKYGIKDVGHIMVPDVMETQSAEYRKMGKEYLQRLPKDMYYVMLSDKRIVFQQNGLNDRNEKSFSTYARIILDTSIGERGDYEKSYWAGPSRGEIAEIDELSKHELEQMMPVSGDRLLKWYGTRAVKINGAMAVRISYLRQQGSNPPVHVDMHMFQNYDRIHYLTISYRKQEEQKWKPLLEKAVNSFTITNIR